MTHQVIAFPRSVRLSAVKAAVTPLPLAAEKCSPAPANNSVALTIALRYLAAHNKIPGGILPHVLRHGELK